LKPYYETKLGKLYHGDCLEILPQLEPVDLVVTSPPYDDLRQYDGYKFDFPKTAAAIKNKLNDGACIVWVVGDSTVDGSESGTSFRQALFFKSIGLNLHDTMIYATNKPPQNSKRYEQEFEYMFVFSEGIPKTFNPIKRNRKWEDKRREKAYHRGKDGEMKKKQKMNINQCTIGNIWYYETGGGHSTRDKIAFNHPAIFPEALARDHILSWSNPGDTVFDCFAGSGTTLKVAENTNRKWIGCEISEKYCEIIAKRLEQETSQLKLFAG